MRKSLFCFEALCLIYEPIHRIEHLIRISKDLVHKGRSDFWACDWSVMTRTFLLLIVSDNCFVSSLNIGHTRLFTGFVLFMYL